MKNSAFKNYVRKWGHFVKNDEYQYPIIPHKYNIGFHLTNCNKQALEFFEPWGDSIIVDMNESDIISYIGKEQQNTQVDLRNKINNTNTENDIQIFLDVNMVTQQSINFIIDISQILDSNELELGEYNFDIFRIKVNKINHLENNLIKYNI
jgi:hypothetical protein